MERSSPDLEGRKLSRVPMVQAANSRKGSNFASTSSGHGSRPTYWRVFCQPQVRPVLVVVADVFCHQPLQMPFIQNDYVVQ